MNYFDFHIGDYRDRTSTLTIAEHGAYLLLIVEACATEAPLPLDRKLIYRALRAVDTDERKTVDSVLDRFWRKTPSGYVNKRVEEVIEKYRSWCESNKANGRKGGRPRKHSEEPKDNPSLIPEKPNGFLGETQMKANGGDRARVPLPTSDFPPPTTHSHTHTPIQDPQSRAPHSGQNGGSEPDPDPKAKGSVCVDKNQPEKTRAQH